MDPGVAAAQGLAGSALAEAVFYTDSSNDLPLLNAVGEPVRVDPGTPLRRHADVTGWPVNHLAR